MLERAEREQFAAARIYLFLCCFSASVACAAALHDLSEEERQDLRCFVKHRMINASGRYRFCCMPPEAEQVSCAVVSNSGALSLDTLGAEIDRHPFVFRLNDAPIVGHEEHVGAKPGFRWGWNAKYVWPNATYVKCGGGVGDVPEAVRNGMKAHRVVCDYNALWDMLRDLMGNSSLRKSGTNSASTGSKVLMFALSGCAEVYAYGFYPNATSLCNQKVPYHYYGRKHTGGGKVHKTWDTEHRLWASLAAPGRPMVERGVLRIPGFQRVTGCSDRAVTTVPRYFIVNRTSPRKAPQRPLNHSRVRPRPPTGAGAAAGGAAPRARAPLSAAAAAARGSKGLAGKRKPPQPRNAPASKAQRQGAAAAPPARPPPLLQLPRRNFLTDSSTAAIRWLGALLLAALASTGCLWVLARRSWARVALRRGGLLFGATGTVAFGCFLQQKLVGRFVELPALLRMGT